MIQVNNGYEEYYYLQEDGAIYNAASGKLLEPDDKHLYRLKQKNKGYKKVSIRTLYKAVYNRPFCHDAIESLENEEWKEITGTEGYYLISNMGRVKSFQSYNAVILKPYSNQSGYLRVDIIEQGKRVSKLVHKLTAAAWLPMPPQMDYQLHHKDFDKQNNKLANLEYLSPADHAKKHSERNKKKNAKDKQSAKSEGDNSCQSSNR